MQIQQLNNTDDVKKNLKALGVDSGGISILASKTKYYRILIKDLAVGGANILKQDALSVGADLAVPRGTVIAATPKVDCILIATKRELQKLAKKELSQPFGLKEVAAFLQKIVAQQDKKPTRIMGVLNANDDSFYAQSRFSAKGALAKIEQMIEDGADIIDIGGVSSRPNAPVVSVEEELSRVEEIYALIEKEKLYQKALFSCDSYEPLVIQKALDSGFGMVNDITGLQNDLVAQLCYGYSASVVIMHMQNTPQTMQNNPHYNDVIADIYQFLAQQIEKAKSFGIADIIVDVGIGFGKTLENNLHLIKHLEHFRNLECEILVGVSRKSMIDMISPSEVSQRLAGTLALHLEAIRNGASIVRVHDVYEHKQALQVHEALQAI